MDRSRFRHFRIHTHRAVFAYGVFFILALFTLSSTYAQTLSREEELKQNISNRTEDIKQLEAEIAQYQARLEDVGNQKKTLQNAVQILDLTRAKLSKDILLTQKKIERTNAAIINLGHNITTQETRIKKNKKTIADSLHKIDQTERSTLIEVVLGNQSLSDFFQDIDDLGRIQIALRDRIESLKRLKKDLGVERSSHEQQQKQLTLLNNQLGDQKEIADGQKQEQAALLKETKNQESNYKKLLADKAARKKQFEREISDFEAQLRAVIDPNSFPPPGTKVLAYPLDNMQITQKFGQTVDARRLYTSGTHNGMDFRASPGTPIKAAADGTIIGFGDTDRACKGASYGRWVMIKHINGLATIYAHLNLIKVGQGQTVSMGDIIGYSGSTGYATGPHLHFGLFVASAVDIRDLPSKACPGAIFHIPVAPLNAYLDPQAYL